MSTVSATDIDYGENKVSLYISTPLSESSRDHPDSRLQTVRDPGRKNRVQLSPAGYRNKVTHSYWNENVKTESTLFPDTNQSLGEQQPTKRKKGPAPKMLGNELCSVCADKASGFHYNVLSCEGCKGFFRRSVIKGAQYSCKNSGQCQMDMYMRRKCQECRLRKCRQAGMLEQCVLSEEQIRLKKMKKLEEEMTKTVRVTSSPLSSWETPRLNVAQIEMIRKLVAVQQQCNKRSFSDRLKVTIMLLETSRRYDPQIQGITFLQDFSYNRDDFAGAGLQFEFINPIFEFSKGMNDLHLDDAEYALLIAINLFSADRPNVEDHELVERLQQPYVEALHSYTRIKRPNDHLMFPRMLMKLVCLRTLSSVHSEQVFALRLQDKKLPPLLSEIWDMHE
ncbi:oxysterols receptor LXR-alpha isoform X2 [Cetorhinus maximus]